MPYIETTVVELAENLANEWGVYGTYEDPYRRAQFVAELTNRIRTAAANERLLAAYRFASVQNFDGCDGPDKRIEPPELTYVNENYIPLKDSCPTLYRIWNRIKQFTRRYNDVH